MKATNIEELRNDLLDEITKIKNDKKIPHEKGARINNQKYNLVLKSCSIQHDQKVHLGDKTPIRFLEEKKTR